MILSHEGPVFIGQSGAQHFWGWDYYNFWHRTDTGLVLSTQDGWRYELRMPDSRVWVAALGLAGVAER